MSATTFYAAQAQDTREWLTVSYCRLSKDPEGKRADFATQWRYQEGIWGMYGAPEPLAEHRFGDDDTSASKVHVVRTGWEEMLAFLSGVDRTRYRVLVTAYSQDRLTRQLGDPKVIADVVERKGGVLHTHVQGQISTKLGGRGHLYINGALATDESEKIQGRTLGGIATAAMAGRRHGIVRYGWAFVGEVDRHGRVIGEDVIDEDASAVVREMARRVLAGDSLRALADDLNARGVPAPGAGRVTRRDRETKEPVAFAGGTWSPAKIRQILLRPSNVGIRVHRVGEGEDRETRRYTAEWAPILDRDLWDSVCSVLADPKRRTSRTNVTTHWLSGIARCGVCGEVVTVQKCKQSRKDAPKYEVYRCPGSHVVKAKARVDVHVEQWVLAWISDPEVRAHLGQGADPDHADAVTRRNALQAKLERVEMEWATGETDDDEYGRLRTLIKAKIAQADAGLRSTRDRSVYDELVSAPVESVAAAWDVMPVARRRAVVAALFDVRLAPSTRRGRSAFDPATIVVTPKGGASLTS